MSLRPAEIAPVSAATAQVAAAAFPKGCPAMRLRDALGAIYDDRMFASLYPARGQPAHSPWRLALVTVLQFTEGLSDRQAADAVRGRIDWKYALGLELTDPGFDFSVLCEFRARLQEGWRLRCRLQLQHKRPRQCGIERCIPARRDLANGGMGKLWLRPAFDDDIRHTLRLTRLRSHYQFASPLSGTGSESLPYARGSIERIPYTCVWAIKPAAETQRRR